MLKSTAKSYAFFFCFSFFLLLCSQTVCAADYVENGKKRYVHYGFTVQNMKNVSLPLGELWFYLPVYETSWQESVSFDVSTAHQVTSDEYGNQIVRIAVENLAPFATRIVTVDARLLLFDKPEKKIEKNMDRYLMSEKNIESNHPEIKSRAKDLKKETPLATARNIFNWVAETIEYSGYQSAVHGALNALQERKGDCSEYMSLFIALCRANDIPARGVGGYVCDRDCLLSPELYHDWAEFYHDGAWRIADPQMKKFMQDESHYIATRLMPHGQNNKQQNFYRYRFSGEGLTVKMMH